MYDLAIYLAIISALMEAVKRAFKLSENLVPLGSVILGLILAFIVKETLSIPETVILGLMLGLSASGLLKIPQTISYVAKQIGEKTAKSSKEK